MDKKSLSAALIAVLMVLVTWALLAQPRQIRGGVDRPVPLKLPAMLGAYQGEAILFCQNDQCLAQFLESEISPGLEICPRCGEGELDAISPGEKLLLPKNTPIFRKRYQLANTPPVDVTVVFSGRERRSIHRPQVCLTAQGQSIQNETEIEVPIAGRDPLMVRVLDLYQSVTLPDGRETALRGAYAYWFFNPERETASHFSRLVRMAFDNILRNYRPRWAYVIVSSNQHGESDQPIVRLQAMIRLLDPLLQSLREDMDLADG